MTGRRRRRAGVGEQARLTHAWLELLQTSGPFLTLPVVHRVFPDGLPPVAAPARAAVRAGVADMLAGNGATRHTVVDFVLRDVLGWNEHHISDLPESLAAPVIEHTTSVRPDFAFVAGADDLDDDPEDESDEETDDDQETDPAAQELTSGAYRMLGVLAPWGTHPLVRTTERGWTASPAERLAVLLRARDVPIGLVTDGRWWALVWAPPRGATGVAVWDASLFSEEPDTLRAFVAFLGRARFTGEIPKNTLPALLKESTERQEEITERLGEQVRDAVELLVGTLDRLDGDSGGGWLRGVDDDELYAAAVTIMMRVVFALFAEERNLLPADDECYTFSYSVGGLVRELRERAELAGRRSLEHRTSAWHRLLAVSRAIHGGVAHEDLRLPAYGGGLFDPDRHPWLEGRGPDGAGRPPPVDDLTVLRMLESVQHIVLDGEERTLSFRALGVEQIGYVYEGLLELEVRTATEVVLHLARHKDWPRSKKGPSEVGVGEVRTWVDAVPPIVVEQIKARTGWTDSTVERTFRDHIDEHLLTAVIGHETQLLDVVRTIAPALRRDERQRPIVTLPGRRYIAPSRRRATTGTHYTPPQLAAEVAIGALEPLVYRPGPLETADRGIWRLRPSEDLLALRVADIAMGSGAFLVAACRWLADRLVEAWTQEGDAEALREAVAGAAVTADAEASPVVLRARRRIAERCLYGVDINPLAVEMGKLSLWLVTMDRERPFGFLDDRFVAGDSLLGLVELDQLEGVHIDPAASRRLHPQGALDYTDGWPALLSQAADMRRRITARPVQELRDVEHKQRMLAEATALTTTLTTVANAITGIGLAHAASPAKRTETAFVQLAIDVGNRLGDDEDRLACAAQENLQGGRPNGLAARTPFHWPIAFPEVIVDRSDRGFDAIIGNPPFSGGQMISGDSGPDYIKWLQRWDGGRKAGSADLAARFVLRAQRLLNSRGQLGYVATNTLVQGKTLVVGMIQAVDRGFTLRRGLSSHPWPGRANLEIVEVWASRAPVASDGEIVLDGEPVREIGPDLEPIGRVRGRPMPLRGNDGVAFQGTNILGTGFTMTPDQAAELIRRDPRNAEALQPYVIGKDLNRRPDSSASRWVINFRNWSLDRAETYPDLISIVRQKVKPKRDTNSDRQRREYWWRFTRPALELYTAIADLDYALAISLVSNAVLPTRVPTGPVFAHACAVFAMDGFADLAVLSSNVHATWVIRYTSTMRTDIRYAPNDVFLTLPRPHNTPRLAELGKRLDTERRDLMLSRAWNLTATYVHHVHNPADSDPAVVNLREIHAAIDHAVLDAYDWDLDPDIGHHPTKIGTRWTLSPRARLELLDLLLEENQRRHALEHDDSAAPSIRCHC